MKFSKLIFLVLTAGVFSSCSNIEIIPVEKIELSESSLTLSVGDEKQLYKTITPSDATYQDVIWSSNNDHVRVSQTGLITALSAGTCTVYCKTLKDKNIFAKCPIKVKESTTKVTSITFDKTTLSMQETESAVITATVKPDNAANKNIKWSSSNNEVATVSDGVVNALKAGTATITATAQDGSGVTANCQVTVSEEIKVSSVDIVRNGSKVTALELKINEQVLLNTDIKPTNALNKDIVWSVSSSDIASVSNGNIIGLKAGTATITATNERSGKSSSISLTVKNEYVDPTFLPSTYYGDYYDDNFSWTNSSDLKTKLYELMNSKRNDVLNYGKNGTNWQTNIAADHTEYDFEYLDVVYSSTDVYASKTNTDWQREHAFAATLMTGQLTGDAVDSDNYKDRANDFQNLFAAFSSANISRGNKNLGNASSTYSVIGDCKYDTKNFEPNDKDKGRLARSLIYMSAMYGQTSFEPLSLKEEYVEFKGVPNNPQAHGNLSTLVDWALNFPVDRLEQQHNTSVATSNVSGKIQGNRNAFVDYPQLVDYLYGSKKNIAGDLKHLIPSVFTLDMYANDSYYNFAIKTAKRTYSVGETITFNDDLTLVNVKKNNSNTSINDLSYFDIEGVSDNYTFTSNDIGVKTITIRKNETNPIIYSKNSTDIQYTIEIVGKDPISECSYTHELGSGTAKDGEFFNIASQSNTVHELNMDGLTWNVFWKESKVGQRNSKQGTQFGTVSESCKSIYFETKDNFSLGGKTSFNKIYFSGACSSGKSGTINIYVNDVNKYTGILAASTEKITYGITFEEALTGKIKIEISNINGAAYIHTLAINAIS